MADSKRKTVIDAIETGLSASTGINKVTQNLEAWWDWDITDFPGVTILDRMTETKRVSYFASTASTWMDSEDVGNITIRAYCQDFNNDLETKRTNLIRSIVQSMYSSTAIKAQTLDVQLIGTDTDQGMIDNYSITDVNFKVIWHYNHLNP